MADGMDQETKLKREGSEGQARIEEEREMPGL